MIFSRFAKMLATNWIDRSAESRAKSFKEVSCVLGHPIGWPKLFFGRQSLDNMHP